MRFHEMNYILDENKKPKREHDLMKWGAWLASSPDRIVATSQFGDISVSTVFLGVDHNFFHPNDPILFETMIFGGVHDNYQKRYRTWDEAHAGHLEAVALVKDSIN